MTTDLSRTHTLGLVAAGLTAAAGLIELVIGSNSWTGDKTEPTTLGILTIVLAAIMATAAVMTGRTPTSGSSLLIAAAITVSALISFTTAGRLAIPGAIIGLIAGAFAIGHAKQRGPIYHAIGRAWPTALVAVLALIYLAFGAIAGPIGALGIVGAVAAIAAFGVRRRSRLLAVCLLVVGVIPFAVAAWWSVVIPLTAILLLAIGIPQLVAGQNPTPVPQG